MANGNDEQLSPEDLAAIMKVRASLPSDDPRGDRIDKFLVSQKSIQNNANAVPTKEPASFRQRFIQSSGLSGIDELSSNMPKNFSDLLSRAAAPAKQAVQTVMAPAKIASDIMAAHKAKDTQGVSEGIGRLMDSFVPGTGNSFDVSKNTAEDVSQGNITGLAGTGTGLATQLAAVTTAAKPKAAIAKASFTPSGELTPMAESILHPTSALENLFRKIIGVPKEAEGASVPITESPYYKQWIEAKKTQVLAAKQAETAAKQAAAAEADARKAVSIKESPYYNQMKAARVAAQEDAVSNQDLITRTKTLVKPGEKPSAADLKRAGDLTQVPLSTLKKLSSFGDELAKNEIRRRLRNQ